MEDVSNGTGRCVGKGVTGKMSRPRTKGTESQP